MQAKPNNNHDEKQVHSLEESISLWLDNEQSIDADQLDSPYGRQLWENYHLIGDVLRSEELAIEPSELFYARLSKAIDEEPIVFAPKALKPPMWRRWLVPTAAVSAALLVTLWFVQPEPVTEVSPILANADDLWGDYIDAHRSLTGGGLATYASYTVGN